MINSHKSKISLDNRNEADIQLKEQQKKIDYDTKDYTIEFLVDKFERGDFFIPDYQRDFVWKDKDKSLFIESVLLGLPIPFMFFGNCDNGRIEIIDGAQRVQTLSAFVNNELKLRDLKKLDKLNKFKFCDLLESQQRKFIEKSLRIVVLEEKTPPDIRQDLFYRINKSGMAATDSEIRRGSYPGKLTTFIEKCAENEKLKKLCPVPEASEKRHERFELILRFFAYVNDYLSFVHDVNVFLDNFLIENLDNFDEMSFEAEYNNMLDFIEKYFPNGFAKSPTSTSTPRVRFEALSVGVALALRARPDLVIVNIDWIDSDEFREFTTSDASNNQGKLRGRIEFVRNKLLEGQ